MESKPLFENVAEEAGKNQTAGEAILLVDCSGSTQGQFDDGKKGSIFDKFSSLAQDLPHENFRLIFWSSINHQKGNFVSGIMSLPFVVKKAAIKSTFLLARPNVGGCT